MTGSELICYANSYPTRLLCAFYFLFNHILYDSAKPLTKNKGCKICENVKRKEMQNQGGGCENRS